MNLRKKFWQSIVAAPIMLPLMLAVFSLVTVLCVLLGVWNMLAVLVVGLVAALAAGVFFFKKTANSFDMTKEARYAALLVLIGVFVWVFFNSFYTSQNLYMGRDPQTYAESAAWIVQQGTPHFEPTGIFGEEANEEQSTRMMLLPYLLSMAGEIGGESFMLHMNPLFGGVALLALFAFGRFLMRDRWALLAAALCSIILPFIYFSRDNYTEPLAMAFVFSALALLALAWKSRKSIVWVAAGGVAGAGMLIRFDSMIPILGIVAALLVLLAVTEREKRRSLLRHIALFTITLVAVIAVAMFNLILNANYYFETHAVLILLQFLALASLSILGGIAVIVSWRTGILQKIDKKTKKWRGKAIIASTLAVVAVLASRPLWLTDRQDRFNGLVKSIEASLGMTPDGYRSYVEQTLNWIVWYMGPIVAFTAVIGLCFVAYRMMYRHHILWLLSFSVFVSALLAYTLFPAVTPDQIWASRRFLVVVFPFTILLGMLLLDWVSQRKRLPLSMSGPVVASVLVVLAFLGPLFVSWPFLQTRTNVPQLAQIEKLCETLPSDSAVLWIGPTAAIAMPQPTRTFCHVPSAAVDELTKTELKEFYERVTDSRKKLIIGMFEKDNQIFNNSKELRPIHSMTYQVLEYQILMPPRDVREVSRSIFLGEVKANGKIIPIK